MTRTHTAPPRQAAPPPATGAATAQDPGVPAFRFEESGPEAWLRISNVDALSPFLVNLPTDTDLWMFISSTGGLTAGRRDPDGALFPYETVDRLHESPHHTGPVTLLRVVRPGAPPVLWEPLAPTPPLGAGLERHLSKTPLGERIRFEEIHRELGLSFRQEWAGADETGWVRTATLTNTGRHTVAVRLLDGVRNLLPSGVALRLQQQSSCLVDAYKQAELDESTGLAVFSLTSRITDRPEPAEELRATTAWTYGLPGARLTLDEAAVVAFRREQSAPITHRLTGRRGALLAHAGFTLAPGAALTWRFALDTRRGHAQVVALRRRLRDPEQAAAWLDEALERSRRGLERIVASADGLQRSGRPLATLHHLADVLYNTMRGGVFVDGHHLPGPAFAEHVRWRDRRVAEEHATWLAALPERIEAGVLRRLALDTRDPVLSRLACEFLPLSFGRRHGDPSRPWNRFEIVVRDADGRPALRHEGNWRDVFQNWEALTRSFPAFMPNVVARFLNASTVDGFNPYRVTHRGVEWEVLDPHDPWSGIGYWGDHQDVYLLRLLEALRDHHPGMLESWLEQDLFAYADVPYRLLSHAEIVAHPRRSIRFDEAREAEVRARVAGRGGDGQLVHGADGRVRSANLLEKLLVPALTKLSSLVPGGGLWMNTERPEWNDANNALAGHGLSVVTACHLRRYLVFVEDLLRAQSGCEPLVATDVIEWLRRTRGWLDAQGARAASDGGDDVARGRAMDELGAAFEAYREAAYATAAVARQPLRTDEAADWCRAARAVLERTIRENRREDGLYHSYNVLVRGPVGGGASVQRLDLMLEGQVAVLESGSLTPTEAAAVVEALFASMLHRDPPGTFLLYPERQLPAFLDRNVVPEAAALRIPLLTRLLDAGRLAVVERDADGTLRFAPDLATVHDVHAALDRLALDPAWAAAVAEGRQAVANLFVDVFGHHAFTGRSSRMFAYEGLGCIYWHMVAKLLLAVQDNALRAARAGDPSATTLAEAYRRVRAGLGPGQPVTEFGAFPTDPYSHTPARGGAEQPGMTGQAKEEVLARLGELGVNVNDGIVRFAPLLLEAREFLPAPAPFTVVDAAGRARTLQLPAGSMGFTLAQVPVVYTIVRRESWVRVTAHDGRVELYEGDALSPAASRALLSRDGTIARIDVGVPLGRLWGQEPGAS